MGRSQETFNKKEVRQRKDKKRKDKEKRRLERKENEKKGGLDDMIAYVDENGMITSSPPDPQRREKIKKGDIEISVAKKDSSEELSVNRKGKVSYFNESKGFGFINDLVSQERIFVHINNMVDDIKEGDTVTFELGKGPKGPIANQVKLLK